MGFVDLINLVAGLTVGLVTGFYFERRSSREARETNEELQSQLARLRSTVLSLGASSVEKRDSKLSDIESSLLDRALSTQDASGRVRRSELVSYLMERGFGRKEIDSSLTRLVESGLAREDDRWLKMA